MRFRRGVIRYILGNVLWEALTSSSVLSIARTVMGIVAGAGLAVLAWFADAPLWQAVFVGLVGFVSVLWLGNGVVWFIRRPAPVVMGDREEGVGTVHPPTAQAPTAKERLFEIILPNELKPGQIYNHKIRYFENVWIARVTTEDRNLIFELDVPGYQFMSATEFQAVYQQYQPAGYFSNPLAVQWRNRQAVLAFVVKTGDGDDSDFTFKIRDVGAGRSFSIPGAGHWVCLSDGTVEAVDI